MPAWNKLTFKFGSEWAPDSPYGQDVLELEADGRFRFENRMRGEIRQSTGRAEPAVVAEVDAGLSAAGFPALPAHPIPPGASLVELLVDGPSGASQKALMHYFSALKLPGYGELIRRFQAWATWLREGGDGQSPPGLTRD
jgi:hypothetical protein